MKTLCHAVSTLLLAVSLLLAFEPSAYAYYVDPGTGLLAYQSVGVLVAGALFHLRRRLRSLFRHS